MATRHVLNVLGDRLRTLPILVLYLTDGCNSRCLTCDIWRSPRRNMRADLVDKLVADAAVLRSRWVVLSGGEAMQHPNWSGIAQRFRGIGARVILLTNGLLVRRQLQSVIEATDELVVSLDGGTPETYSAIRGVDAFDLVLSGIESASSAGKPVITRTTLQKANFREMPQTIHAALRAGAGRISFLTVDVSNPVAFGPRFVADAALPVLGSPGVSAGSAAAPDSAPTDSALTLEECDELSVVLDQVERDFADAFATGRLAESPAKLRQMVSYFRAIQGAEPFPPVRCNAPHISAVVEVDGRVRPCYFLPTMGRVHHSAEGVTLPQALNSAAALDLRRSYHAGERPECGACVCPLHKGARSLLQL
ncbi:MAG: radical SAM protein [Anaerolineae bacterium]|nr:radical SAM protein [Anaerolineae bacterium]